MIIASAKSKDRNLLLLACLACSAMPKTFREPSCVTMNFLDQMRSIGVCKVENQSHPVVRIRNVASFTSGGYP
jgi:hypothetical protein